jgi:hypothetical protein
LLLEPIFDADFPGQYMRRIKSVALSIPCITGPYTGINCVLSLNENSIRTKEMLENDSAKFDKPPFDKVPIQGIATSHGQADNGSFELNYSGDTYVPFEGAGVISTWNIELPSPVRQFDYNTISDVIMHLRYTSRAPKDVQTKGNAIKSVQDYVSSKDKGNMQALVDVRAEYPAEFREINSALKSSQSYLLKLKDFTSRVPFWAQSREITSHTVYVVVDVAKPAEGSKKEDGEAPEFVWNGAITDDGSPKPLPSLSVVGDTTRRKVFGADKVDKSKFELVVQAKAGTPSLERLMIVVKYSVG